MDDEVIEPGLPIVDSHHHLWFTPPAALRALEERTDPAAPMLRRIYGARPRYLLEEIVDDVSAGHDVRATCYVEGHAMLRADGPEALRSVGEVEFASGMAAMSASGLYGSARIAATIVGGVDLRRGDAVAAILDEHLRAGGDRYRGVRAPGVAHDPGLPGRAGTPGLLGDAAFGRGAVRVAERGLSLDVYVLDPQLGELATFADACPDLPVVLNHMGTPLGTGPDEGRHAERFPAWRAAITALAQRPNVSVKLGGLGNPICGFAVPSIKGMPLAVALAALWRPYVETCIAAFGVSRCMFESNFPVDAATADYRTVWNALKLTAQGASAGEKAALFSGRAARVYRIKLPERAG